MNTNQSPEEYLESKSMEDYRFRFLEESDYTKGYFELLQQLTSAEKCEENVWKVKFAEIKKLTNLDIIVIEHRKTGKVIGSVSFLYEPKFIRNLGYVSHLEDFVIDAEHRKVNLGAIMLEIANFFAAYRKCYKIILDCNDSVVKFYEKNGYSVKSKGMAIYLNK